MVDLKIVARVSQRGVREENIQNGIRTSDSRRICRGSKLSTRHTAKTLRRIADTKRFSSSHTWPVFL